jgi:nucleoside-diphosphate-sugar epimerase
MLSGEKILVTGVAGNIAKPLSAYLAKDNEVWGVARFSRPGGREEMEALGVHTHPCDLAAGAFDDLPKDFTYVLHLAALTNGDITYDEAITVNAEATGLLMQHCRTAKAILVMSTHSVYQPWDDPLHLFLETDPIGDCNSTSTPTYSVSKIAQEAVARTCARAFGVPTLIARMNAAYTPYAGLPAMHAAAVVNGDTVVTRWDPCTYSLIHQDDINRQAEALLDAAAVPAPIVNWAGDDWASVQDYCAYVGELVGKEAKVEWRYPPGTLRGSIASNERRLALTGPCEVPWREGMRRNVAERWPDLVKQ